MHNANPGSTRIIVYGLVAIVCSGASLRCAAVTVPLESRKKFELRVDSRTYVRSPRHHYLDFDGAFELDKNVLNPIIHRTVLATRYSGLYRWKGMPV